MPAPFHDDDSLDIAEQTLLRIQAQTFEVLEVIRRHREHVPRVITHDGSLPVSPLGSCADEPPSLPVES